MKFAPIALQVKSRLCGDLSNVGDGQASMTADSQKKRPQSFALQFRRHMKLGLRVGLKVFKGIERRQKPDAAIPQLDESLLLHLMQRARCGRPVASNETAELLMGELHFVECASFACQPACIKTPAGITSPGS